MYCIFVRKRIFHCSCSFVQNQEKCDHNEIHLCALSIGFQHISIVPSLLTPSTCAQKSLQYIYVQRVLVSRDLSFLWEWEGSAPSSHFSLFTKFPSLFSLPPISNSSHSIEKPFSLIPSPSNCPPPIRYQSPSHLFPLPPPPPSPSLHLLPPLSLSGVSASIIHISLLLQLSFKQLWVETFHLLFLIWNKST